MNERVDCVRFLRPDIYWHICYAPPPPNFFSPSLFRFPLISCENSRLLKSMK